MKLADMRERIIIEKAEVLVDEFGNRTNEYITYCSRWTYANKKTGNEKFVGKKTSEKETLTFLVRRDSLTKNITPGGYRVIFHGKKYNITSVDNFKFRNESIKIDAEETDD